jgi:hypothetical protein
MTFVLSKQQEVRWLYYVHVLIICELPCSYVHTSRSLLANGHVIMYSDSNSQMQGSFQIREGE